MSRVPVGAGDALVVYETATGRVRRWLVPDEDGHLDPELLPDESALRVPADRKGNLHHFQALVHEHREHREHRAKK